MVFRYWIQYQFCNIYIYLLLVINAIIYYIYRLAESKKEIANQHYSQKQYKKALVGYNEVIGKYSCDYISIRIAKFR